MTDVTGFDPKQMATRNELYAYLPIIPENLRQTFMQQVAVYDRIREDLERAEAERIQEENLRREAEDRCHRLLTLVREFRRLNISEQGTRVLPDKP